MFTDQELEQLQIFLGRVDIKGTEAIALGSLQIKIGNMRVAKMPVEPKKENEEVKNDKKS